MGGEPEQLMLLVVSKSARRSINKAGTIKALHQLEWLVTSTVESSSKLPCFTRKLDKLV